MDRKHAAPVTRAVLAVVPVVTDAGNGNAGQGPVTAPVTGPVTPSSETAGVTGNAGASVAVVPITMPERVGAAVRRLPGTVANAAGELWLPIGRFLHSFVRPEPETMKEHWVHVQSRAWVPEELTGTPEKVVAAAGIVHHLFVAYPLKAAAKGAKFAAEKVDEVADRPLRLYGLVLFVALLVLLFVL